MCRICAAVEEEAEAKQFAATHTHSTHTKGDSNNEHDLFCLSLAASSSVVREANENEKK